MEKAVWLSYIFGPYMVILGVWMLLYHDNMMKVCTAIKNNAGLFYSASCANLFVGLVVINLWNVWLGNLTFLVALLGWVMAVRGGLGFFMPQLVVKCWTNNSWSRVAGIIPLAWGILLCILAGMGMPVSE